MWVSVRKLVTAASTVVVAIALAICMPVSQLRTAAFQTECCCPDPDQCKCPDHKPDEGTQPAMRACHKTQRDFVAPVSPTFVAPVIELVTAPQAVAIEPVLSLRVPHPAPTPQRPDAPS